MTADMFAMQAFTGLSIFTILLLMALGLAIVFGLMGVINMAHGELMAMGAYTSYGTAYFFQHYLPGYMDAYIFVGIALAFVVTSFFGFLLERGLIRMRGLPPCKSGPLNTGATAPPVTTDTVDHCRQ